MKSIDDNYITIQGWMPSRLNLKGAKLMTFALIYGFCQDGKTRFRGSISYISSWTNTSDRQVQKVLNELQDEKLIFKFSGDTNGVDVNEYGINFKEVERIKKFTPEKSSPLKKVRETGEKSSPEGVKKVRETGEKSSPNNIVDNIVNNIGIEKTPATENETQLLEAENNEQQISGSIQYELEAYKKAARFFCETYGKLNTTWKNAAYALPYFQNKQKNGNWYELQIPTTAEQRQRWLGQHLSGIEQWAAREHKFNPQKNGSPAQIPGGYRIPKVNFETEK